MHAIVKIVQKGMLILTGAALFSAHAVTLVFKDTVLTSDTIVFLGDIARIDCKDNELKEKLENVIAANSAPAGYSRFLNVSDFLLYRLKPQFGDIQFDISGSQRVIIKTDFVEKKIIDYQTMIQDYFSKEVKWPHGCWEMVLKEPQRSWKCLPSSITVHVEGLQSSYPRGNVQIRLVAEQGLHKINIPVMCNVKVVMPVLVASRLIIRGEQITAKDCELKPMNITGFGPQPLFEMDSLVGVRAVRSINPGTIIHTRLIQAMPEVEKGDLVEILVCKGRVKVAVQGIAREAGKTGERIWVENTSSRKLVQAVIKDKGTVTIAHGGSSI